MLCVCDLFGLHAPHLRRHTAAAREQKRRDSPPHAALLTLTSMLCGRYPNQLGVCGGFLPPPRAVIQETHV